MMSGWLIAGVILAAMFVTNFRPVMIHTKKITDFVHLIGHGSLTVYTSEIGAGHDLAVKNKPLRTFLLLTGHLFPMLLGTGLTILSFYLVSPVMGAISLFVGAALLFSGINELANTTITTSAKRRKTDATFLAETTGKGEDTTWVGVLWALSLGLPLVIAALVILL